MALVLRREGRRLGGVEPLKLRDTRCVPKTPSCLIRQQLSLVRGQFDVVAGEPLADGLVARTVGAQLALDLVAGTRRVGPEVAPSVSESVPAPTLRRRLTLLLEV